MASLTLAAGRRDRVGGPIARLSGRFSTNVPRLRFTYVMITDCVRFVQIGKRIPSGARSVFSFIRSDLVDPCRQLNPNFDWYVYVRCEGIRDDYSNTYLFPFNTTTSRNTNQNIKTVKGRRLRREKFLLSLMGKQIKVLTEASRSSDKWASIYDKVGLSGFADRKVEESADLVDEMRRMVIDKERAEKNLRKLKSEYHKYLGILNGK